MRTLQSLVHNLLKKQADWKLDLLQNWEYIVGSLNIRISLEKIDKNILTIGVFEIHWMQELYLMSSVLLEHINKYLGSSQIKRLKFKLVKAPNKKKMRKKVALYTHIPKHKKHITTDDQQVLEAIQDTELRQFLREYYANIPR